MDEEFFQAGPAAPHPFRGDGLLRSYLRRSLGAARAEVEAELDAFGERLLREAAPLAAGAEAKEPRHVPYDPWGRRIDAVEMAEEWQALGRLSAEEGLVAIGYERKLGARSRLHQFAKLYLFHPYSAVYTCPLAMTDGAARILELSGDAEMRARVLPRYLSRDPARFWTSGQWMTERAGGSDVGRTATVARRSGAGWLLHGSKWFTSAVTAETALTLARIEDESGSSLPGSRGLSLFFLELRDEGGRLQNIELLRLKNKLGTRALPTAELRMCGTPAVLLGEMGAGVRSIAPLLNLTRLYNAACAAAALRHGYVLARSYAGRRQAFGARLADLPLHAETLAELAAAAAGAFHLLFHAVLLLGRAECGEAGAEEAALLRLLVPLAKLATAKWCVAGSSEVLECFGGAGYVEDTGLPKLLRDSQVLSIWEGTTNVLSLDALRVLEQGGVLESFLGRAERRCAERARGSLAAQSAALSDAIQEIRRGVERLDKHGAAASRAAARELALSLARVYAGALLLEHARWCGENEDPYERRALAAARRWCRRPLVSLSEPLEGDARDRELLAREEDE